MVPARRCPLGTERHLPRPDRRRPRPDATPGAGLRRRAPPRGGRWRRPRGSGGDVDAEHRGRRQRRPAHRNRYRRQPGAGEQAVRGRSDGGPVGGVTVDRPRRRSATEGPTDPHGRVVTDQAAQRLRHRVDHGLVAGEARIGLGAPPRHGVAAGAPVRHGTRRAARNGPRRRGRRAGSRPAAAAGCTPPACTRPVRRRRPPATRSRAAHPAGEPGPVEEDARHVHHAGVGARLVGEDPLRHGDQEVLELLRQQARGGEEPPMPCPPVGQTGADRTAPTVQFGRRFRPRCPGSPCPRCTASSTRGSRGPPASGCDRPHRAPRRNGSRARTHPGREPFRRRSLRHGSQGPVHRGGEVLAPLVGQIDQHPAGTSASARRNESNRTARCMATSPGRPKGLPIGKFTNTERGGRTCSVRSRPVDTSTVGMPAASMTRATRPTVW